MVVILKLLLICQIINNWWHFLHHLHKYDMGSVEPVEILSTCACVLLWEQIWSGWAENSVPRRTKTCSDVNHHESHRWCLGQPPATRYQFGLQCTVQSYNSSQIVVKHTLPQTSAVLLCLSLSPLDTKKVMFSDGTKHNM